MCHSTPVTRRIDDELQTIAARSLDQLAIHGAVRERLLEVAATLDAGRNLDAHAQREAREASLRMVTAAKNLALPVGVEPGIFPEAYFALADDVYDSPVARP